ncbi:MAG: hypothetical protein H6741_24425 [Alphaproteobacteria bacterium]|nr:hypothetical protein [Alphaproteobacteria bacterium]MCB9795855.1 hypothetical protein [Alphaproteobacteria bacterium]
MVFITYKRRDQSAPAVSQLTAEQLFDPVEPGEVWACDSVPKHLELARFVGATPAELDWIDVHIVDEDVGARRVWRERYWGADASCRSSILADFLGSDVQKIERVLHLTDPMSGAVHILRFGPLDDVAPAGVRAHSMGWRDDGGQERWSNMLYAVPSSS